MMPQECVKRFHRNRKRSKRRGIHCLIHECYLDSVSSKYKLFADRAEQLLQRGVPSLSARALIVTKTAVPIEGEWLEKFWCPQCQRTEWYYITKQDNSYRVSLAPRHLWQQVTGVTHPDGNPSVSQFTRRHSQGVHIN